MIELTDEQSVAMLAIDKWLDDDLTKKPFFYLAGYAGTGKTTMLKYIIDKGKGLNILQAAFMGKAALRMQQVTDYPASTIHSLIYNVDDGDSDEDLSFILNPHSQMRNAHLLLLDECPTVNDTIAEDLLSFNRPILAIGDQGQLPPVSGSSFFNSITPDATLSTICRQALDSGIITVATNIRNGKILGRYSAKDVCIYPLSREINRQQLVMDADQIITGKNDTRIRINKYVRGQLGYTDKLPQIGDRLICLKNNRKLGLFNGLQGTVENINECDEFRINLDIHTELGMRKEVEILPQCFSNPLAVKDMHWAEKENTEEFDYAYCITVHKSQGSQWDNVLVIDDGMMVWNRQARAKWLYTAVTRAAKQLTVLRAST